MLHGRSDKGAKPLASPLRIAAWLCVVLAAPWPGAAAQELEGSPPVTRMEIGVDVFPQNFDVAQGADSVVYVANSEGVLAFDGETWQLIALPNGDLARTLAFDGDQRVYVGGSNYFGYLRRGADGTMGYHDLTKRFAEQLNGEAFFDIWNITVSPQGVFFEALHHLFLWLYPESCG